MSATGSQTRRRADRGFTLIEAVVVVGITGLVSALLFPNMQRMLGVLALRQTACVLASNLQLARAGAIRTGAPVAVSIAPDGRSYSWNASAWAAAPLDVRLASGGGRPIVFYADASTTGGVIVVEGEGRRILVGVDPFTGAVTRAGA
jgi:general secretion pathway protein H